MATKKELECQVKTQAKTIEAMEEKLIEAGIIKPANLMTEIEEHESTTIELARNIEANAVEKINMLIRDCESATGRVLRFHPSDEMRDARSFLKPFKKYEDECMAPETHLTFTGSVKVNPAEIGIGLDRIPDDIKRAINSAKMRDALLLVAHKAASQHNFPNVGRFTAWANEVLQEGYVK